MGKHLEEGTIDWIPNGACLALENSRGDGDDMMDLVLNLVKDMQDVKEALANLPRNGS